jgi:hypothetical protein
MIGSNRPGNAIDWIDPSFVERNRSLCRAVEPGTRYHFPIISF